MGRFAMKRILGVILGAALCLSASAEDKSIDAASDEVLIQAAEKLVSEAKLVPAEEAGASQDATAAGATENSESATVEASNKPSQTPKESDIPIVFKGKSEASAKGQSMIWRLAASFGILLVVVGVMIVAGKRWSRKKNITGQLAKIEFMSQHHLGPKRSLALVRVAGEAMLIGITEQNINLIKTVTLIDSELENSLGPDFNNFLEDEFSVEDVRSALRTRA